MTASMDRDEVLRRFEAMLDAAWAAEAPPSGIDAEILSAVMGDVQDEDRRCDSYSLWAAMTALTQEVKLQGRAFQELSHTAAAQAGKIGEELRLLYAERERTVQRETERRCRKEALSALIDLRGPAWPGTGVGTRAASRGRSGRGPSQVVDPVIHEAGGGRRGGFRGVDSGLRTWH